jgi:hypothetical protein
LKLKWLRKKEEFTISLRMLKAKLEIRQEIITDKGMLYILTATSTLEIMSTDRELVKENIFMLTETVTKEHSFRIKSMG